MRNFATRIQGKVVRKDGSVLGGHDEIEPHRKAVQ